MVEEWSVPVWVLVALAAASLLLLVAASLLLARVRRDLGELRSRVAVLETPQQATAAPAPAEAPAAARPVDRGQEDYVITTVGAPTTPEQRAPAVPAPLFADLVLRESVVQAASWTAGLRRALSPEVRHRIRLEVRREVKRSRKQRRADLRAARRDWEARQRGTLDEGSAA
ncbi:hypothetical protein [Nocardioides sp. SYSU DS0663]|uniref:hypothetical protein n=1 Tax=Nocardioides sp. SYSU DS0663 TaxID=3416445 RepID=UPI003F4C3232